MIPSSLFRRHWVWVVFPLVGIAILTSCRPEQKDRVMHFFFEIPDEPSESIEDPPEVTAEEQAPTTLPAVASQPSKFGHPGFRDHRCSDCHIKDQPELQAASFDALCLKCHQQVTQGQQVLHAPVSAGDCKACHVHHESEYAGLLVMQLTDLCLNCHKRKTIESTPTHQTQMNRQCSDCHQSHSGETRMLLKPTASAPAG